MCLACIAKVIIFETKRKLNAEPKFHLTNYITCLLCKSIADPERFNNKLSHICFCTFTQTLKNGFN